MLVFMNLSLMEFQMRYLALFRLFSVIDSFKWFWMESLHKNTQLILMMEKLNWFCLICLITPMLLIWRCMGLFLRKNHAFKMMRLAFSSKLDWSFYIISIISIAKTASKKVGALIDSMKFVSPKVALYLQKFTIAWNNVVTSGLVLLAATWIVR